jgi:hypothetical protein
LGVELLGTEPLFAGVEDSAVCVDVAGGGAAAGGAFTATLGAAFTSGGVYGFSTGVSFAGAGDAGARDSGVRDADADGSERRSFAADAGALSVAEDGAVAFTSLDFPAVSLDAELLGAELPEGVLPGTATFGAAFASGAVFPAGGAVVSGAVGAGVAGGESTGCAGVAACSFVEVLGVIAGAFEEAVDGALPRFAAIVFTWFNLSWTICRTSSIIGQLRTRSGPSANPSAKQAATIKMDIAAIDQKLLGRLSFAESDACAP